MLWTVVVNIVVVITILLLFSSRPPGCASSEIAIFQEGEEDLI